MWGCQGAGGVSLETGCEEDGNFTDTENKTITREGAAEEVLGHQLGLDWRKMAIKVIKSTSQFPVTFFFTGVLTDNTFLFTGAP